MVNELRTKIITSRILTALRRKHKHCNIALVFGGSIFALKNPGPLTFAGFLGCSLVGLMASPPLLMSLR